MEGDIQTSHGFKFPTMTEKMDGSTLIAKERGIADLKDRSPRPVALELEQKARFEGKGEKYSSPRSSPIYD